ncbi:unnamed protein product [Orchesella dallaii]|uniref:TATA-binding protein-associated factor 172 n=1 Tax=Orchesella dallaii TaxID=48710 RepID=A0ABP1R996_9HEXA
MASRLDRLFVLLETGSTPATRKAAAQQLGQVQRLHPHELPQLLSRVQKCLRSTTWETRVAAGQAVEAIVSQIPQWNPPGVEIKQEGRCSVIVKPDPDGCNSTCQSPAPPPPVPIVRKSRLTFKSFNIDKLLNKDAQFLMASEARVFDNVDQGQIGVPYDPARQRNLINKRLGLDIAEKIGIDTSDIVSNEDLVIDDGMCSSSSEEQSQPRELPIAQFLVGGTTSVASPVPPSPLFMRSDSGLWESGSDEPLSSRELNLAKRRARKQKSREVGCGADGQPGDGSVTPTGAGPGLPGANGKKFKREDSVCLSETNGDGGTPYVVGEDVWPLSGWADVLINDLFSPSWEIRHGAATALREVIRLHGKGGGRETNCLANEMERFHQDWLEDLALRLVSVLALDRFGDFVSDQVVAPVRETCSQCLGTVLSLMTDSSVALLLNLLIRLLKEKSWEVRHGSLLALKYLFAVRTDLVSTVLPAAFPTIFLCLSDRNDDVTAVAASALIPVTGQLVEHLPHEAPSVVNVLWDSLENLDDLSSACNSIMGLLATLLAFPAARSNLRQLDVLIPRLWPFLHHTSSSVRKSALLTLQKLTELDPSVAPMSVSPLQVTLRHVYQRALVENYAEVLELIPQVWCDLLKSSQLNSLLLAACPLFGQWLCLAMQPPRAPLDPNILVPKILHENKRLKLQSLETPVEPQKLFMGGSEDGDPNRIAATRLILAKMLGELAPYIVRPVTVDAPGEPPIEIFVRILLTHLNSRSALQRTATSFVIAAWPSEPATKNKLCNGSEVNGKTMKVTRTIPKSHNGLSKRLLDCLSENVYFDEIAMGFTRLQSECKDFVATLKHYKVPLRHDIESNNPAAFFSFDQIEALANVSIIEGIQKTIKKNKVVDTLLERRKTIFNIWSSTTAEFAALNTLTLAALSGALCSMENSLPEKLNPVVKPLMESIRKEENALFQRNSADHLCHLMELVLSRNPCPIPKIVQNLVGFLCSEEDTSVVIDEQEGILSLASLGTEPTGTGSIVNNSKKLTKAEEQAEADSRKSGIIQKRGATFALTRIVRYFGANVPKQVARLWELTFGVLDQSATLNESSKQALKPIIDALQVLEIISPYFHADLFPTIESQIERMCGLLSHNIRAVRHMASRCLSVWADIMAEKVMPIIAKKVVPRLDAGENDVTRQGAIEAMWCIVDRLGLNLLPYIVLLVVPVLGRMSDQNDSVRMLASLTFATLVRLMPLEGGVPDPPNLPLDLVQQKSEQRQFLEQLLDPSKIPEYGVTVPIQAELRPYQQAGINWLGFLNKFKLHGILCDDMGLGKTLQSICILGSDHLEREEKYKEDQSPDSIPLPSIVICPPTLTGHWVYEVEKFISRDYLNPLHYHGPPVERNKLKPKVKKHNLVVASYDIVRNDIDFFSSIRWNYCILDEGHIIKNGKTKISKAIKQLKANHRLILSGTPIQNNVLELWSLFDFLMPGFLGTEKQFSAKFARPILMARDPKSSPKEQEAGALAMESLHRQALPFLLRRLKEDVLQDLPPKITQDYYCDLSSIQEQLYEDFARTKAHQCLRETFTSVDDPTKHSHIFQALQYLRKVCNHPKLVLTAQHPKFQHITSYLSQTKSTLDDINHSAKLPALKQLLLDCGIGVTDSNSSLESFEVVNQHRALIFCQLKVMLDILENDLFKAHMPSVTYLRLDGSVPAGQRHSLVTRFNNDPSIDVLLLTTQVGGLGLNLTGADTVIFVEHDWNPMRDLQAMDRAHRIGQKKVVNVYRLITRGTLEEKIMGLQKFKLMTANTVISQDNACMETMHTDQLLDLFVLEDPKGDKRYEKKEDVGSIVGAYKNVLENLPELWEEKLYEEEYDLSTFIKNLGK